MVASATEGVFQESTSIRKKFKTCLPLVRSAILPVKIRPAVQPVTAVQPVLADWVAANWVAAGADVTADASIVSWISRTRLTMFLQEESYVVNAGRIRFVPLIAKFA